MDDYVFIGYSKTGAKMAKLLNPITSYEIISRTKGSKKEIVYEVLIKAQKVSMLTIKENIPNDHPEYDELRLRVVSKKGFFGWSIKDVSPIIVE